MPQWNAFKIQKRILAPREPHSLRECGLKSILDFGLAFGRATGHFPVFEATNIRDVLVAHLFQRFAG